jgi:hypothetical protein
MKNILTICYGNEINDVYNFCTIHLLKRTASNKKCFFTGKFASLKAIFKVNSKYTLAKMCGVKVDELPDVLQHYKEDSMYSGNSTLDNLDPAEFVLNNFWSKQSYNVGIYFSKYYYNNKRKEKGLPPNKFWQKDGK